MGNAIRKRAAGWPRGKLLVMLKIYGLVLELELG